MNAFTIETWTPREADLDALAEVLHATVHGGGSVSFVAPFSLDDARAFWRDKILPGVVEGWRIVLVARIDGAIAGTVQFSLDTPPNQPHRTEVTKLLVHPRARRLGMARALMLALEDAARARHRTLLTLDTVMGGVAERLYRSLGYQTVGVIPRYALNPAGTALETTTILYKELAG